jgi:dihydrofolate reductase
MRKLKLQMHTSIDGIVSGIIGQAPFNWDQELRQYSIDNARKATTILVGRKIASDFIRHWQSVADNPHDPDCELGTLISEIPKVIFSKTVQDAEWPNATVLTGDIVGHVNALKRQAGGDMIVYGGRGFVASLVEHHLIDEYHLLLNPVAAGSGQAIFSGLSEIARYRLCTTQVSSTGTVLLQYEPRA